MIIAKRATKHNKPGITPGLEHLVAMDGLIF
jgi:hypothetical protein